MSKILDFYITLNEGANLAQEAAEHFHDTDHRFAREKGLEREFESLSGNYNERSVIISLWLPATQKRVHTYSYNSGEISAGYMYCDIEIIYTIGLHGNNLQILDIAELTPQGKEKLNTAELPAYSRLHSVVLNADKHGKLFTEYNNLGELK